MLSNKYIKNKTIKIWGATDAEYTVKSNKETALIECQKLWNELEIA
jgi:hypothetical protein